MFKFCLFGGRRLDVEPLWDLFKSYPFLLKRFEAAKYEQAKTVSRTFSFSRRYLMAKFVNRVYSTHSQRLRGQANFSLNTDIFNFFDYCYWMCKHTQVPFFI